MCRNGTACEISISWVQEVHLARTKKKLKISSKYRNSIHERSRAGPVSSLINFKHSFEPLTHVHCTWFQIEAGESKRRYALSTTKGLWLCFGLILELPEIYRAVESESGSTNSEKPESESETVNFQQLSMGVELKTKLESG